MYYKSFELKNIAIRHIITCRINLKHNLAHNLHIFKNKIHYIREEKMSEMKEIASALKH